jgi:hypothetical protein
VKYICMEDIESLAAQGKKELVVDENTVLMDLARDTARELGITIITPAQASAPSAPIRNASPAAPAPSATVSAPRLDARPKGCQHGPLPAAAPRPEQPKGQPGSGGVVDQLVELVRQSTARPSGS